MDRHEKVKERPALTTEAQRLATLLQEKRNSLNKPVLDLSEARSALSAVENVVADDKLERLVVEAGWAILYTWNGLYVLNTYSYLH